MMCNNKLSLILTAEKMWPMTANKLNSQNRSLHFYFLSSTSLQVIIILWWDNCLCSSQVDNQTWFDATLAQNERNLKYYNSRPNVLTLLSNVFIKGNLKLWHNSFHELPNQQYSYLWGVNKCQVKGCPWHSSKTGGPKDWVLIHNLLNNKLHSF